MTEKRIELRRGGWFVINEGPRDWSGPWKTERAAKLAAQERWDEAHRAERNQSE